MSRSLKRSMMNALQRESGRVPIIHKLPDGEVSHSKDCYMCHSGTKPKRMLFVKPRRAREKRELDKLVFDELAV